MHTYAHISSCVWAGCVCSSLNGKCTLQYTGVCVCSGQVWKSSVYKVGKFETSSSVQTVKTILLEMWDFFNVEGKKVNDLCYSLVHRPAWKCFMSAKDLRRIRFVNTVAELSNTDTIICIYHFYGCLMLWMGFCFVKPCGK